MKNSKTKRCAVLICCALLTFNAAALADDGFFFDTEPCDDIYSSDAEVGLCESDENFELMPGAQLFADGIVNLAIGKTVTAKTEDGKAIGLIDGNTTVASKASATKQGAWTFLSKAENYAVVDLGAIYSISAIKAYFGYSDGVDKPNTGFRISHSIDNVNFADIVNIADGNYKWNYAIDIEAPTLVRYIKLTIPSAVESRVVRVRELEIYGIDDPMINIVQNNSVTVSTDHEDGLALGMVDGDNTSSGKATANAKGAWTYNESASAVIDLGGAYSVKLINAYFGDKNGADKPKSFVIEVSADNKNWKPFAAETDGDYEYNYSKYYGDGINCRFVRLSISGPNDGSNDFKVREIEIYGVETDYPIAADVVIYGTNTVGSVLRADYNYSHTADVAQGDSVFNWYSVADDGARLFIGTGETYTVADSDLGGSIVCGVVPLDENGVHGDEVFSVQTSEITVGTAFALNLFNVAENGNATVEYTVSNFDGKTLKAMLWTYSEYSLTGYDECEVSSDGTVALSAGSVGSDVYALTVIADSVTNKPIYANIKNIQPSAQNFDNTDISAVYDETTETFALCGVADASAVYFEVCQKDGTKLFSGAAMINGGRLYKSIAFPTGTPSADYTIDAYFLGSADPISLDIHFSSVADKRKAFEKLALATSANEFALVLKDNISVLEISDKYVKNMTAAQLEKVCENMYKNTYSYEEIARFYGDLKKQSALFVIGSGGSEAYDAAVYYNDVLNFDSGVMYAEYEKLKAKNKVFAMFYTVPKDDDEAVKMFDEFTFLQLINEAESYGKIAEYIATYSAVIPFDLSVYNSSDTVRTSLYLFENGGSYTSMAQLEADIIKAKAAQSAMGGSGSGLGGSSSRGSSGAKDSIAVGGDLINSNNGYYTQAFADVSRDYWAAGYISELKTNGVVSGDENGNFNPENEITREEFIKMLVIASGMHDPKAVCNFSDLSTCPWAQSYVASAVANGVINGNGNSEFGAGEKLTRQDMAVMIYRALGITSSAQTVHFTDEENISDYALEAVAALSADGIINGFEDGSFRPSETARRSQAAKLICTLAKIK